MNIPDQCRDCIFEHVLSKTELPSHCALKKTSDELFREMQIRNLSQVALVTSILMLLLGLLLLIFI